MRAWLRPWLFLLALGVFVTAGRAGALALEAAGDDCCPETTAAERGDDDCPPLCDCHCCAHVSPAVPEGPTVAPGAPRTGPLAAATAGELPPGRSRGVEYPPNR